jgi:hypothetical protein
MALSLTNKSLQRTLILYLAFAFLISSVLTIIIILIEYNPSTKKTFEKFGLGVMVLNSVLWSLLFTVTGSLSLLNVYSSVKGNFLLSLLSFLLIPALLGFTTINSVERAEDIFGFTEAFISFLTVQTFLFFRFRSCLRKKNTIVIE